MPTYEYNCHDCNHDFDIFFKTFGSVTDITVCPKCSSDKTKKRMSVFASSESAEAQEFMGCGPGCGCVTDH